MPDEKPWARPLDDVLRLDRAGDGVFTAELCGFGGVTLGCATRAAALTCPGRALHSLHTYFMRPVTRGATVEIAVEPLRDGRRFALRRVQVREGDKLLCEVMASFTAPGDGMEYQEVTVDPATPPPEGLATEEEIARAEGWKMEDPGPLGGPLEWRWIGIPWRPAEQASSRYLAWVRPRFPIGDDSALHAAAIAFLSDYHSHFPAARRLRAHFEPFGYASLDQVLWVHRECAWDDWWLLSSESEIAHAGRAFTRRILHARDGKLVASMAQEQLIPPAAG